MVLPLLVMLLAQDAQFRTTAPVVLVPVSVKDKAGKTIDRLSRSDFEVYENGQIRNHTFEFSLPPVSVVIAIQSSSVSGPALAKIQKIGSMIQPLIAGEDGYAAVLSYSTQVKLRQDFTADAEKITKAFRKIEPDGGGGDMHGAVAEAVRMLSAREGRRILILIGEAKARSGNLKLEEVITQAQAANVIVYPLSYSAYVTAFTSRGGEQFASGQTVIDTQQTNLMQIFAELALAGSRNGHQALAKYTGGVQFSFAKLKGLEQVMAKVGEDLHTQYLLSFVPTPMSTPGYRSIEVRLPRQANAVVRTRPGYWPVQ